MKRRFGSRSGNRPRHAIAVLTLAGHLLAVLGFPLPVSASNRLKDTSQPYPCQDRPCGCASADECWQGDCCCFTLEEKLAWADANGVEPPGHVRPLVESRKGRPVARPGPACCSESEGGHRTVSPNPPVIRWVSGFFAQKCHGTGPAGLFQLEPSTAPLRPAHRPAAPRVVGIIPDRLTSPPTASQRPPIPPPRRS